MAEQIVNHENKSYTACRLGRDQRGSKDLTYYHKGRLIKLDDERQILVRYKGEVYKAKTFRMYQMSSNGFRASVDIQGVKIDSEFISNASQLEILVYKKGVVRNAQSRSLINHLSHMLSSFGVKL